VLFQPCRSSSLLVTLKMSCYVSMNEVKWWWWWCSWLIFIIIWLSWSRSSWSSLLSYYVRAAIVQQRSRQLSGQCTLSFMSSGGAGTVSVLIKMSKL